MHGKKLSTRFSKVQYLTLVAAILAGGSDAWAAKVATYLFNNVLTAEEAGVPALTAVDPLGQNGFETATVLGQSRQVYRRQGNAAPNDQEAGLTLDTSSILTSTDNYSLELVLELDTTSGWRRVFDVNGRTTEYGLYLNDHLVVFPAPSGTIHIPQNEYHYIAVVVNKGIVDGYVDGVRDLSGPTTVLNIVNPVVSFFLDNSNNEYSNGRVAMIRLTDRALGGCEIATRAANPFAPAVPPEPSAPVLMSAVSRRDHNGPFFDICAAVNAAPAVEPRQSAGNARVVLTFSAPVQAMDGSIDCGQEVTVTNGTCTTGVASGNVLTLNMTFNNNACVTVTVNGLLDAPFVSTVTFLAHQGDVNGNGTVNILDLQAVKNQLNHGVGPTTFKMDVNVNGAINILDLQAVKNNLNQPATCP